MRGRMLGAVSAAVFGLILVGSAREMRADTVFSNFGPSQTYVGNSWWAVGAAGTGVTEVNAFSFVPTETATVTGADLALAALSAATPLTVYIESNTGASPGTILDTLTQTGSYGTYPTTDVVNFACTGSCTTLDAGTTYWIVGQATDPANTTYWLWNFGQMATWYYNNADSATGPWNVAMPVGFSAPDTSGAFDVTGLPGSTSPGTGSTSPIPEPGSLALLGSGLVGIMAAVRRRA